MVPTAHSLLERIGRRAAYFRSGAASGIFSANMQRRSVLATNILWLSSTLGWGAPIKGRTQDGLRKGASRNTLSFECGAAISIDLSGINTGRQPSVMP